MPSLGGQLWPLLRRLVCCCFLCWRHVCEHLVCWGLSWRAFSLQFGQVDAVWLQPFADIVRQALFSIDKGTADR